MKVKVIVLPGIKGLKDFQKWKAESESDQFTNEMVRLLFSEWAKLVVNRSSFTLVKKTLIYIVGSLNKILVN